MTSLNKVILIGTLGRDPEIRSFSNGGRVCNLSVATSERWKDKATGEKKEITEWHKVAVFNEHLIKFAEGYLTKGSKIYLEGKMQTRKWTDKDGVDKYTTEVVVQQFKGELMSLGGNTAPAKEELYGDNQFKAAAGEAKPIASLDDDIPF